MSTPSQIRAVWADNVWNQDTVTDITENIYDYPVILDSQSEAGRLYYKGVINFFQYLVTRAPDEFETSNKVTYKHRVEVNYYKELDKTGQAFNDVIDTLISIESLVRTQINDNWNSTVDFHRIVRVDDPVLEILDGREVWRGLTLYEADDRTDLT